MAIDIGADAIDRTYAAGNASRNVCYIEGSNPATVAGKIKKVYVYLDTDCGTAYIGTFYKTNGDTFSSRDYEQESQLPAGLNELDVDIDVEVGDYIGIHMIKLAYIDLDYDAGWTNDYWRTLEATSFPYTDYEFNNLGKRIISLYGEITAPAAPTVTIQAVTDIITTTATGNGNVTDLGSASVTQHGHCWSTTETPTTADDKTENGAVAATGAFTSSLTGLTVGTLYYVRAYATNSEGTSYSGEVNFTAGAPGSGERSGVIKIVETRFHYLDAYGAERYIEGTIV